MGRFKGAWVGVCLLALMACGTTAGSSDGARPAEDAGLHRTPSKATAGIAPASARAEQPNIVVVMLDDFSMDLVQTMRSVQMMM